MGFGFVMMAQIILGIVWIGHILYFTFEVKNKANKYKEKLIKA